MQKQLTGTSFAFSLAEISGALADLGVMLLLVLALISLNGMDATAAFFGIGRVLAMSLSPAVIITALSGMQSSVWA